MASGGWSDCFDIMSATRASALAGGERRVDRTVRLAALERPQFDMRRPKAVSQETTPKVAVGAPRSSDLKNDFPWPVRGRIQTVRFWEARGG